MDSNLLGLFGMGTSPMASQMEPPMMPELGAADGEFGEFQSLLNLVQDLEPGDFQDGVSYSDFVSQASQLSDSSGRALAAEAGMAQMGLAQLEIQAAPKELVGRLATPVAGETISANEWLLNSNGVDALSERALYEQSKANMKPDANSVAKWALAIAAGDLTSVEVGEEVNSKANSKENALAEAKPKFEALDLPKVQHLSVKELGSERTQKVLSKTSAADLVESKPKSASEFLLDSTHSRAAMAAGAGLVSDPKGTPALIGGSDLGGPSELRISPQSVSFVADRIEALKANGGGTVRVELNPVELGGIEIRVSMRGRKLEVKLSAEKASTQAAFEAARSELTQKLEGIKPARLEIGTMTRLVAGGTTLSIAGRNSEGQLNALKQSGSSSEQMLDLRTQSSVSESKLDQNMQRIDTGARNDGANVAKSVVTSDVRTEMRSEIRSGTEFSGTFSNFAQSGKPMASTGSTSSGGSGLDSQGRGSRESEAKDSSGHMADSRDQKRERARGFWEEEFQDKRKHA